MGDYLIEVDPEPLLLKGVRRIYYIKSTSISRVNSIRDAWKIAGEVAYKLSHRLEINKYKLEFIDNEPIGTNYMLYRFRLFTEDKWVASIRIVTHKNSLHIVVATTSIS